ncbi:MAG: (2Fe-2S)-binding protein [Chloroflexi bacterium]|nr:(2Fe-2S)-binding protein [Chloroflexota bacterium]MBV9603375.1 (2Fe-2S)-binding protein [Chloroflexota bacterium]
MNTATVEFTVNGDKRSAEVEVRKTLADFLRDDLGLTGTHLGCEHGVCGSCTVLVDGDAVRSCLMLAVQADGAEVLTIEGLAAADGSMHPIQEAFMESHAFQCGFCTPGFVMSVYELLTSAPGGLAPEEIRPALSGNLCRCTGYQSIVAGVQLAQQKLAAAAGAQGVAR